MPIPKPRKTESKKEFIRRFMSDKIMKKEFPNIKQRYAIALSIYKKYNSTNESCLKLYLEYIKLL